LATGTENIGKRTDCRFIRPTRGFHTVARCGQRRLHELLQSIARSSPVRIRSARVRLVLTQHVALQCQHFLGRCIARAETLVLTLTAKQRKAELHLYSNEVRELASIAVFDAHGPIGLVVLSSESNVRLREASLLRIAIQVWMRAKCAEQVIEWRWLRKRRQCVGDRA